MFGFQQKVYIYIYIYTYYDEIKKVKNLENIFFQMLIIQFIVFIV